MLSLLADENLDANILRGVLRRFDGIDVVRVQDIGLTGTDDPTVLAWAAEHCRVLITHDVETVTRYAFERVDAGLPSNRSVPSSFYPLSRRGRGLGRGRNGLGD